ncbi:MAG: tetratricopeptide repeat protein [Candidatus Eisenbacteria bacterium]|nr:tetratricopeptide repeat protein [Candidatus Eisenbacteria bacterium]
MALTSEHAHRGAFLSGDARLGHGRLGGLHPLHQLPDPGLVDASAPVHDSGRPGERREGRVMRRTSRPRARVLLAALLCLVVLTGCGRHDALVERYRAERMAWGVEKLQAAVTANPDLATDATRADLEARHRGIVASFPPPEGDPSDVVRQTARISATSRFSLASLALTQGDLEEAKRWYASVADSYAFDRELTLEALSQLARVNRASGAWDEAVAVYGRLFEEFSPTAEAGGLPDSRILSAPLRIADGYRERGMEDEADEWYTKARSYYRRLIQESPDGPTARAALGEIAETYVRQERWSEAVEAYVELDERFGDENSRGQIWLTLARIYGDELSREGVARDYYERVEEAYGGDESGATASIAIARYDIEAGRYEEARRRLENVLESFGDEERFAATASYLLAQSYELDGEWDAAAARYQSLARDFPATMYGLRAPLHVADRYERIGEMSGARSALSRAVEHYRMVTRDYAGTPAELAAGAYLIDALIRLERWEEAASELVAFVDRHPQADAAPGMLFQAGMVHENELGAPERARTLYNRVLEGYPESERASDARSRLEELPR